jgi:ribonuclease HI
MILPWKLYVDESSNINISGVMIVLISLKEHVFEYEVHFEFPTMNNVFDYKGFITGLYLVEALNAYPLQVHSDS